MTHDADMAIRLAAFGRLQQLERQHGPVLTWEVISEGFVYERRRLLFANKARGIFRPESMPSAAALSIKSIAPRSGRARPYPDVFSYDGTLLYRFQGQDPQAWDNRLLWEAYDQQLPLIYFCGLAPGQYQPIWPVYIHEFDAERLRCEVVTGELEVYAGAARAAESTLQIERRYATRQIQQRLHQSTFRVQVLQAYRERCAICRLPARALLEAAHIIPDKEELGRPEVPNGIALCRLHHGAFDTELLGIRPDLVIELSPLLLGAQDGPTLEFGLKGFHGRPLVNLPTRRAEWPRPDYLAQRYASFEAANQVGR